MQFEHRIPREDLGLGIVVAEDIVATPTPPALATALGELVRRRASTQLGPEEEAMRGAARDILRNGSYKPTGRGKPASEYLLREVTGAFPAINGPVDANNLISLKYLVPISVWDLDRAASEHFVFRLGRSDESYVFNAGGQAIALRDLVCGCATRGDGEHPIVCPIKDSAETKTQPDTTRIAAAIYCPLTGGESTLLEAMTRELEGWLAQCGHAARAVSSVLRPGSTITLN